MKAILVAALWISFLGRFSSSIHAQQSGGSGNSGATNPVVFESTDYSRGFDSSEQANNKWYTSVCQASAPMNTANDPGPPYVDLNVNDHIKVKFAAGTKQNYSIVVDDNTLITLAQANGGSDETLLTITGRVPLSGAAEKAHVYVYGNQVPQTPANASATLEVYVLPLRQLYLGIWYVEDGSRLGNTDVPAAINQARIQDAFNYVRKTYRQACIVFLPVTQGALSNRVNAPYDKDMIVANPPPQQLPALPDYLQNNAYDMSRIDTTINKWVEHVQLQSSLQTNYPAGAEVNLAIVKILDDGSNQLHNYTKDGLTAAIGDSASVIHGNHLALPGIEWENEWGFENREG